MSSAQSINVDPTAEKLPWRLIGAISLGTILNPLNSSMISVAVLYLRSDFAISIAQATWVISGFYLAAAIGQPLMGRLADLLGPRRVFCSGLLLVCGVGALASWAPTFGSVVALQVLQAFGTSAAYPAGMSMMRAYAQAKAGEGSTVTRPPAAALGALSISASVSAALGPALGGILVLVAGWHAIFLVNIPLTLLGLFMAIRVLPKDTSGQLKIDGSPHLVAQSIFSVLRLVDIPGIVLFGATIVSLLFFLISMSVNLWWLLPVTLVAAVLLVVWERRATAPFINVRMLASNRRLVGVYGQYAAVNLVYYSMFFGLPLWLEQARGFDAGLTGLIMLPFAGLGMVATFAAVRIIQAAGIRAVLVVGSLILTLGTFLLLLFETTTPLPVLVAVTVILGIPNGFQNMGLQTALYDAAPAAEMGVAAGQFQTFRYLGSILSSSLLGVIFGSTITSAGLHTIALALPVIGVLLLLLSLNRRLT